MISGRYDWLFYKRGFLGSSCVPPGEFLRPLAEIDALTEMANAAGLAMVVSVSPDKSTIYPEKLLSTDRRYWNCKRENGRFWRRLAASEAPLVIDHAVPLLSARGSPDATYTFTATRTGRLTPRHLVCVNC